MARYCMHIGVMLVLKGWQSTAPSRVMTFTRSLTRMTPEAMRPVAMRPTKGSSSIMVTSICTAQPDAVTHNQLCSHGQACNIVQGTYDISCMWRRRHHGYGEVQQKQLLTLVSASSSPVGAGTRRVMASSSGARDPPSGRSLLSGSSAAAQPCSAPAPMGVAPRSTRRRHRGRAQRYCAAA
jgi:hypothetical protein